MGIAAFTATSLARPLHTLQRWWQQFHPGSALWKDPVQGAAQTDPCAASVVALRRPCNTASTASVATENWHVPASHHMESPSLASPSASARALGLPAFRRLNHRDFSRHHSASARQGSLKMEKPLCTVPALKVLHRPASLARPGGLVIAGRMADVCAELDRLVALETVH